MNGVPEFSALQAALGAREGPGYKAAHEAVFYAFDLLHLDGNDLRTVPLEQRKERLASLLGGIRRDGHRLPQRLEAPRLSVSLWPTRRLAED